jgi:hypothetical protein
MLARYLYKCGFILTGALVGAFFGYAITVLLGCGLGHFVWWCALGKRQAPAVGG